MAVEEGVEEEVVVAVGDEVVEVTTLDKLSNDPVDQYRQTSFTNTSDLRGTMLAPPRRTLRGGTFLQIRHLRGGPLMPKRASHCAETSSGAMTRVRHMVLHGNIMRRKQ